MAMKPNTAISIVALGFAMVASAVLKPPYVPSPRRIALTRAFRAGAADRRHAHTARVRHPPEPRHRPAAVPGCGDQSRWPVSGPQLARERDRRHAARYLVPAAGCPEHETAPFLALARTDRRRPLGRRHARAISTAREQLYQVRPYASVTLHTALAIAALGVSFVAGTARSEHRAGALQPASRRPHGPPRCCRSPSSCR